MNQEYDIPSTVKELFEKHKLETMPLMSAKGFEAAIQERDEYRDKEFLRAKEIEIRSIALALVSLKASKSWKQLDNLIEQLIEIYKLDLFEDKQ